MEISIKELRVGNLVETPTNKTHAVKEIFIKGEDCEGAYLIDNWELNAIKPIPLTEEWLIKLGFEINGFSDYVLDNNGLLRLLAGGDNTENAGYVRMHQNGNWIGLNHIKYVHQLQNLYLDLTGEELTTETK